MLCLSASVVGFVLNDCVACVSVASGETQREMHILSMEQCNYVDTENVTHLCSPAGSL